MAEVGLKLLAVGGSMLRDTWLKSYDPDAFDGGGDVEGTHDPAEAMRFVDMSAALECWKLQSTVMPLRLDGQPNRPLSAFTVEVAALP